MQVLGFVFVFDNFQDFCLAVRDLGRFKISGGIGLQLERWVEGFWDFLRFEVC